MAIHLHIRSCFCRSRSAVVLSNRRNVLFLSNWRLRCFLQYWTSSMIHKIPGSWLHWQLLVVTNSRCLARLLSTCMNHHLCSFERNWIWSLVRLWHPRNLSFRLLTCQWTEFLHKWLNLTRWDWVFRFLKGFEGTWQTCKVRGTWFGTFCCIVERMLWTVCTCQWWSIEQEEWWLKTLPMIWLSLLYFWWILI